MTWISTCKKQNFQDGQYLRWDVSKFPKNYSTYNQFKVFNVTEVEYLNTFDTHVKKVARFSLAVQSRDFICASEIISH